MFSQHFMDFFFYIQGGRKSLADKFEYVMHGKLYRISEEGSGANVKAYVVSLYYLYMYFYLIVKIGEISQRHTYYKFKRSYQ